MDGVAPPGWANSVERMKRHKDITNPFALAWWMRKRGARPHRADVHADDASFDNDVEFWREAQGCLARMGASGAIPAVFVSAGLGEAWAQAFCLNGQPLYEEPA